MLFTRSEYFHKRRQIFICSPSAVNRKHYLVETTAKSFITNQMMLKIRSHFVRIIAKNAASQGASSFYKPFAA